MRLCPCTQVRLWPLLSTLKLTFYIPYDTLTAEVRAVPAPHPISAPPAPPHFVSAFSGPALATYNSQAISKLEPTSPGPPLSLPPQTVAQQFEAVSSLRELRSLSMSAYCRNVGKVRTALQKPRALAVWAVHAPLSCLQPHGTNEQFCHGLSMCLGKSCELSRSAVCLHLCHSHSCMHLLSWTAGLHTAARGGEAADQPAPPALPAPEPRLCCSGEDGLLCFRLLSITLVWEEPTPPGCHAPLLP